MIKILVIDNQQSHTRKITDAIKAKFGENVEIYPNDSAELRELYGNINKGREKKDENDDCSLYDAILNKYQAVNLFIIDNYLLNNTDENGTDFSKYILKKIAINEYADNVRICIISTGQMNEIEDDRVFYFSKNTSGKHFSSDLADKVYNLFQNEYIGLIDNNQIQLTNEPPQTLPKDLSYYLHKAWSFCRYQGTRLVDKLILISFYFLIIATLIYATVNITSTIYQSLLKSSNYPENNSNRTKEDNSNKTKEDNSEAKDLANESESKSEETSILKTSEHIFLYLLPLFIIFGFFHYYQSNAQFSLLAGNTNSINHERSTKTMDITKILFTSSIISYVIIKIIEEISEAKSIEQLPINKLRLIAYGVLLLMLITYYILLSRKKH